MNAVWNEKRFKKPTNFEKTLWLNETIKIWSWGRKWTYLSIGTQMKYMSKGLDKGQRRLWLALVKVFFSVTSISLYNVSLIALTMSWIRGKMPVKCNRPTWKERQWARAIERGVLYWGHSNIGPLDSSPLVPTAPPGPGESSAQSGLAHLLSSSAAFKICGHLLII